MSTTSIHPTALVDPKAELGDNITIGAYAIVGAGVTIGSGTEVGAHAVVEGHTTIGKNNRIFHHASVGTEPQDLKFHGEDSKLIVGDHNVIREFVTIHLGTEHGGLATKIGSHNLLMNFTHVAHDTTLGDHNIMANGAQLAGHVVLENYVNVGALVGVHQFVRVGQSAIVGAGAMVSQDIPPFCMATGDRAHLHGLNSVGLKRRGFSEETVTNLKKAYRSIFRSKGKMADALAKTREEFPSVDEVETLIQFIESSERGVCREKRGSG